ncbi:MAG: hypothetical protein ACYC6Y_22595 [Thermoguttaceae bacterium]
MTTGNDWTWRRIGGGRLTAPLLAVSILAACCSCRGPAAGWQPHRSMNSCPPGGMASMQPPGPGVMVPPAQAVLDGPEGFPQHHPIDELLFDGGDRNQHAKVLPNWEVRNLDTEDTIAHYDTLDGRRVVEPSNRVQIYSPRFSAVRQVVSLRLNEQMHTSSAVSQEQMMRAAKETQLVRSSTQNVQTVENASRDLANAFESQQGGGTLAGRTELRAFQQDTFLPYENLVAIRTGGYEVSEMARLATSADAAITWTHDLGVLVIIDRERATAAVRDQALATVYGVDERPGSPRLRIIKVASTANALPGETVDFTLRFDNVGSQMIGNVTIIDNLTTRLELVPGTAECSLKANFLTEPNEGNSLALRWEILDPVMPKEGGVIRFRCLVR